MSTKMTVVAVAGGTGGVGRAIVNALVAQGKHEIKVLSRDANSTKEAELGVPIIAVDYNDVTGVTAILEDNNVHTVISANNMMPPAGNAELNLIKAAEASRSTKRMVSSDWGTDHPEGGEKVLPTLQTRGAAWNALEATKTLEWTVFRNGYFMDTFGMPKVKSFLQPSTVILDIANDSAAIPGDGNTKAVFTHTTDVGKFVAGSLDLDKWEHISYVVGDRLTWNEFVKLAEAAKGRKFRVVHDDVEKLKRGQVTELPAQPAIYPYYPKEQFQAFAAAFGLWFTQGVFDIAEDKALNKQLPQIKTLKVKEMLEQAWKL